MDGQTLKTGSKKDEGKTRLDLLPFDALEGAGRVLTDGAKKYDARNWEKGLLYSRVYGAVLRHLFEWWMAPLFGKSSINTTDGNNSHLDHAAVNILFLSAFEKRGMRDFDDRPGVPHGDSNGQRT